MVPFVPYLGSFEGKGLVFNLVSVAESDDLVDVCRCCIGTVAVGVRSVGLLVVDFDGGVA